MWMTWKKTWRSAPTLKHSYQQYINKYKQDSILSFINKLCQMLCQMLLHKTIYEFKISFGGDVED